MKRSTASAKTSEAKPGVSSAIPSPHDVPGADPIDLVLSVLTGLGIGLLLGGVSSHASKDPLVATILNNKFESLKGLFSITQPISPPPPPQPSASGEDEGKDSYGRDQRLRSKITKQTGLEAVKPQTTKDKHDTLPS